MSIRGWVVIFLAVALCSTVAGACIGSMQVAVAAGRPPIAAAGAKIPADSDAVDMFGNEVSPAVATYDLDSFGGSVERHSPDTRFIRLRAPET